MKMVVRIYWESVKILWTSRLLIFIPLFNLFLVVFVHRANRNYLGLPGLLADLFEFSAHVVLELMVIATVFKTRNVPLFSVSTWDVAIKYFWRFIGINIASVFAVLLVLSPFCFFLFLLATAELNYIFSVLFVFVYFLFVILFFGVCSLGSRILVSQNRNITESMWTGFRELNTNRSYYIWFITLAFLLLSLPSFGINIISLKQIGLTIYSVPFVPYEKFWDNYLLIRNSVSGFGINMIFGVYRSFVSLINTAAITLVYVNRPVLQSSIKNLNIQS